ncbi:MAG: hypothetical protein BGO31_13970 [Bacteroidetes bacterium 43-16]|nr:MAG: hypothetical protein BGO31_13970 [Bacteroidetes bacterium 43-16]
MKKCFIPFSIAFVTIFTACDKQEQIIDKTTTTTSTNDSNVRAKGIGVKLQFKAGHAASQCHGQGACFNYTPGYWPNYVHIPCQGNGTDCSWEIEVGTGYGTSSTVSEIAGYAEETFLMPSRSLFIPEASVYVNIPQQVLLKEEGGYRFNNLSYTNRPIFENK